MAAALAALSFTGCGAEALAPSSEVDSSSAFAELGECSWDPGFGLQSCQQSEWWVEFSVRDTTVSKLQVEIAGSTKVITLSTRVALGAGGVKFTGGPNGRLRTGTSIRLKATQSATAGGRVAYSNWFPYMQATPVVDCPPPACTPSCAPGACGVSDGCGGTCGPCATGQSCIDNQCVCVPACGANVCGSDGCGGSCGACGNGTTCMGGQCVCTPTCAPGACGGSDGCGGTCACACAAGSTCTASGSCCVPNTNTCGPDGCGNDRGPCPACTWDPKFGSVSCSQGEWWVEFSVVDTVASMQVEVTTATGTRTISLPSRVSIGGGLVKFTGSPGSPIATGTQVRLKVTQTAAAGGQQATSTWFAYLQGAPRLDCPNACTPSCAPGACGTPDGCGGTCGPCASGQSCVDNQCVCVPSCGANTCGSDGCGGTCGTCATGSTCTGGQCVCTPSCAPGACGTSDGCGGTCGPCASGQSCVNNQCVCVPSCGANTCGSDGCGGTCGTCTGGTTCQGGQCVAGCVASWDPAWGTTPTTGAWWAEVTVSGGGALTTAVSVENVATGARHPLTYGWGRWSGGVTNLQAGTLVKIHATNSLGGTSRTVAFRYMVDLAPTTDACATTPSTNTACAPLSRGMVSFTLDDSGDSQPNLAIPLMQRYGVKGTFYVIPQWHSWTALARQLATEGHEFASHGMTHNTMTQMTAQQLDDELRLAKAWIETNIGGGPVESFATPSAAYNDTVLTAAKRHYRSHRTGAADFNFTGTDVFKLTTDFMYNTTTSATVCDKLRQAAAQKGWYVLTFHDFTTGTATQGFTMTTPVFEAILACATTTPGLDIVTVREGANRIRCGSPQ